MKYKLIISSFLVHKNCGCSGNCLYLLICNLQKEVSRLRGLVNDGDNQDNDSLAVSFPGTPGTLKWDGLHGSMSPFTAGRRMSQVLNITS